MLDSRHLTLEARISFLRLLQPRAFSQNAPNGRRCSPVSAIPITEKLLFNAWGWEAMKPARELVKGGRVSEPKYEPPLPSDYVRKARRITAPACESKARSTSRISAAYVRHLDTASNPKCPIKGPILDGFADVFGSDGVGGGEIGDGAGDLQNAVVGAGAQV